MSDLELLMLAAKAAGMLPVKEGKELDYTRSGGLAFCGLGEYVQWNPLADDGDALRLAVILELDVLTHGAIFENQHAAMITNGAFDDYQLEPHGDDMFAAVRRAIVSASAKIGEAMP